MSERSLLVQSTECIQSNSSFQFSVINALVGQLCSFIIALCRESCTKSGGGGQNTIEDYLSSQVYYTNLKLVNGRSGGYLRAWVQEVGILR